MTGNAVKSIYLTEAAQKEGRKRIMEKDLKDKKPAENGTPKVPWPKLIPAAAVIAALVFSGIKAQGSDESTESVQKADSTVMSASELEKYFGYEEETSVSGASTADNKKSSTPKKTTSKKSTKKTTTKTGQLLSNMCGCQMTPRIEGKMFLTKEKMTVRFVEDVNFRILYGAAKVTKDRETISGDNYMCTAEDNGQFFMCLSDGMGSGLEACKESEHVVDLLEQLVESGFSGESAAKLVNSVLNLQMRGGKFSTVDVSIIDLYTGMCHFLKAGAATTFIKRDQWVESISSESMALGLVFPADYESLTKKLYNGDFLIMVTDGVLDALPEERAEETLKEIILQTHAKAPQELGRGILQKVLALCEYKAADDMTVLAAGVWKK